MWLSKHAKDIAESMCKRIYVGMTHWISSIIEFSHSMVNCVATLHIGESYVEN